MINRGAYNFCSEHAQFVRQSLDSSLGMSCPIEFTCSRIYLDATLLRLSSSQKWNDVFFAEQLYNHTSHKFLNDDYLQNMKRYDFHSGSPRNKMEADFCSRTNLNSFFVVQRKRKNFIELSTFATNAENSNLVNSFLNNRDKYEGFVDSFADKLNGAEFSDDPNVRVSLGNFHHPEKLDFSQKYPLTASVSLSPREYECLRHTAFGKTSKEVARFMNISPKTVEGHIANIKAKMNVTRRSDLVDAFFSSSLVSCVLDFP